MSLGKFEPGALKAMKDHGNSNDKHYDINVPSIQALCNGFSDTYHIIQASNPDYQHLDRTERDVETDLKKYIHIEVHPNGGASLVHMYDNEFAHLDSKSKEKLAILFFEEVFREELDNVAKHVIGIIHNAAAYMPEMVSHLATTKPDIDVKVRL